MDVVIVGFAPLDGCCIDKLQPLTVRYEQALARRRPCSSNRYRCRAGLMGAQPLSDALHGARKAIQVVRLEKIVDRIEIERLHRMLVKGGHEHDQRRARWLEL